MKTKEELRQDVIMLNIQVMKLEATLKEVAIEARQEWLDWNDPCDGTDCVTPFDRYLYGS